MYKSIKDNDYEIISDVCLFFLKRRMPVEMWLF